MRLAVFFAIVAAFAGAASLPAAAPNVAKSIVIPAAVRARIALAGQALPAAELRRRNWSAANGQGSCVHAALQNLFVWQGRADLANWWGAHHAGGETPDSLSPALEVARIRFAETRSADENFLEWACRTRRGAAVVVQDGRHMVNLVGLNNESAVILDSNSPDRPRTMARSDFVRDWKQSGGWAITPLVGSPSPPLPWLVKESP